MDLHPVVRRRPTLVVRYEVDDNAVDDVVKGRTAVAANEQGPMASVDLLATGRQHQVPRARDSALVTTSAMMTTIEESVRLLDRWWYHRQRPS